MKRLAALFLLLALMLSSCAAQESLSPAEPVPSPDREEPSDAPEEPSAGKDAPAAGPETPSPAVGVPEREALTGAEKRLASMTTEEKVGQLFLIRPESLEPSLTPKQAHAMSAFGVTAVTDAMR